MEAAECCGVCRRNECDPHVIVISPATLKERLTHESDGDDVVIRRSADRDVAIHGFRDALTGERETAPVD